MAMRYYVHGYTACGTRLIGSDGFCGKIWHRICGCCDRTHARMWSQSSGNGIQFLGTVNATKCKLFTLLVHPSYRKDLHWVL
jgi:hypothetical protein